MVSQDLIEAAKIRVRKLSTDKLDEDIKQLAETAACDLKRIGVSVGALEKPDALIREAILTYVNANYGNHPDREKLMQSYNMLLIKIKGGKYRDE